MKRERKKYLKSESVREGKRKETEGEKALRTRG
jgi:hypothetical protein